jgi:hypothetical protein
MPLETTPVYVVQTSCGPSWLWEDIDAWTFAFYSDAESAAAREAEKEEWSGLFKVYVRVVYRTTKGDTICKEF